MGFSSGGGLSLLLLSEAQKVNLPLPGAVVGFSSWLDATASTESMYNSIHDPFVDTRVVKFVSSVARKLVVDPADEMHWSPFFHPVQGFPPILIIMSLHECCTDELLEYGQRAKKAGVDITLFTRPHLPHAYAIFYGFTPEGKEAMDHTVTWIKKRMNVTGAQ
eukprot:NODE_4051_length_870_cov_36.964677_g3737_i0.p1 GENE.NODE_4051_length_870_cov_36.964677_g3737_i0~~NODE_4051_length_870_cov_36.964677_g3737_i0.p1  ORF type:complete len:163 (-),score=29.57 NODE_4051_length_870_cov_36.964677_g3737_i0:99-587(-)